MKNEKRKKKKKKLTNTDKQTDTSEKHVDRINVLFRYI